MSEADEIQNKQDQHVSSSDNDTTDSITDHNPSTTSWMIRSIESFQKTIVAVSASIETTITTTAQKTQEGVSVGLNSVTDLLSKTEQAFHFTELQVRRLLFENVAVSSIAGSSFAGIKISTLKPSFRKDGSDVSAVEALAGSSDKRLLLLVPGLFCDEGMWSKLLPTFDELGYFPLFLRFNPGAHISDNGKALVSMISDIQKLTERPIDIITYSQGGLILRSALYTMNDTSKLGRLLLVSSPDGGSYIEKIGFWANSLMDMIPLGVMNFIGKIGNERSDAMKDLSHGIIREEDWQNDAHPDRYGKNYYFGELDSMDAFQVYSLITESKDNIASLLGDGVVERQSLEKLKEVYQKLPKTNIDRSSCLTGLSHYNIIGSEDLYNHIRNVFQQGSLPT